MTSPLQIGRSIDKGNIKGHIARQDYAKSPGSDGASPYQPALTCLRHQPLQIGRPIDKGVQGPIARQDHAESPGSDAASPYRPALLRLRPHPLQIVAPIAKRIHWGSHHEAGSREKPRFGRSLTLPPGPKANYDFRTSSESCFSASSQSSRA
jgi:hypothetical protein